jgi:hypothetical protein
VSSLELLEILEDIAQVTANRKQHRDLSTRLMQVESHPLTDDTSIKFPPEKQVTRRLENSMQELRCKRSLLLSNGLECWQLFLLLFLKSRFRVECASLLTVSPENYVFILFRVEDRAGIPDDAPPSMLEASTVIGQLVSDPTRKKICFYSN